MDGQMDDRYPTVLIKWLIVISKSACGFGITWDEIIHVNQNPNNLISRCCVQGSETNHATMFIKSPRIGVNEHLNIN